MEKNYTKQHILTKNRVKSTHFLAIFYQMLEKLHISTPVGVKMCIFFKKLHINTHFKNLAKKKLHKKTPKNALKREILTFLAKNTHFYTFLGKFAYVILIYNMGLCQRIMLVISLSDDIQL